LVGQFWFGRQSCPAGQQEAGASDFLLSVPPPCLDQHRAHVESLWWLSQRVCSRQSATLSIDICQIECGFFIFACSTDPTSRDV